MFSFHLMILYVRYIESIFVLEVQIKGVYFDFFYDTKVQA